MSVSNGQAANAATFNGAFVSKTADSTVSGTITQDKESVLKEIATPATPASGYGKIYFKSDGKLYQLNDAGTETVVGAGAGGGGGLNYIANGSAEDNNTTGWATYADTGATPVDGTGGTANVTISTTATTPLIGTYSFLMAKDAVNRQGQGWSYAFTIDSAYKAKVLQIDFEYQVASGTFVAGTSSADSDVTVWIYDVTNAVVIQPSNYKLLSNSSSLSSRFSATFQSASNSTSYRLIFHVATTSASAYTLEVDGISVAPEQYIYGTPVTDWQSYTPTFNGFGTPTNVDFQWRRVGSDVEIRGKFTSGTTTAVEARVGLPSITSADTSRIASLQLCGFGARNVANAENIQILIEPSVTYFTLGRQESALAGVTKQNGNGIAASGNIISFFARAPISGWSSSVQTSDQTDTRVVSAVMQTQASNYTLPSSGDITWSGGTIFDTHGAFNGTTSYVVPVSGIYQIGIEGANTSANTYFWVYKNGTQLANSFGIVAYGTSTTIGSGYLVDKFNAGDILTIRSNSAGSTILYYSASTYRTTWSVTRLSGPSAIAASESVNASYYLSANFAASTAVPINFDTREFDSHGSVTTSATAWKFTAQTSGTYSISALGGAVGTTWQGMIYKNGVAYKLLLDAPVSARYGTGTTNIKLNAGDYIDIRPTASVTIYGGPLTGATGGACHIAITKVGN